MTLSLTFVLSISIVGVFVIGPGEQGVLFQHQEKEFGDHADLKDVMAAVNNMKSSS